MKIVFLTDQTYLHGGVERVLSTKANYFVDKMGNEVSIITTEQKGNLPSYPLSSQINCIDLGVNYHRDLSYFHPKNVKKSLHHFFEIKKTLKSLRPDVVIVCNYGFDFFFLPYVLPKIPKIKEFHSSKYFEHQRKPIGFKENLMSFFNKNAEKKYHHLVVLNPDEKAFYSNTHVSVIPNPILLQDCIANFQSHKMIAAGRISPVKRFDELIDIFNAAKESLKDWELHIYGEDYLETQKSLRQKIKEYQLENQIKIFPATERLLEILPEYSIYVMTSETECFPMVLLESLSVGLPIISYDCPTGPRHIVKNGENGFLVKDRSEFITQLKQLTQDEHLRSVFSKKAKTEVVQFSDKTVMQLWEKLLVNLQHV